MTRLLIVDDHPAILDAARNALLAAGVAETIDRASTLQEAREILAREAGFALVILDLSLTDARRLEAVLAMRESHPDVPVLIFSGDESTETIANAFECSARGYVPKSQPLAVLEGAVRAVLAGGTYIPPQALRAMGMELSPAPTPPKEARAALPNLTARQSDAYRLLLQGMPNKVIASRLDISEHTVKEHLRIVYRELNVHNRAQAVLRGRQFGLI
jgi:DNA-binding NarL/FixJ family response regulator